MSEPMTTISIRSEDHAWLRERQRKISFERDKTVPMWDLIHELLNAVREIEAAS